MKPQSKSGDFAKTPLFLLKSLSKGYFEPEPRPFICYICLLRL
jgi:hypothetical protein